MWVSGFDKQTDSSQTRPQIVLVTQVVLVTITIPGAPDPVSQIQVTRFQASTSR